MSPIDLSGRAAIVTGAGAGLGRCHALALAARGARLIVNDADAAAAHRVANAIRDGGGEAIAAEGSVTDAASMASVVSAGLAAFGRIDILVNNAGVLRDRTFAKMSLEDFRLVLDVHVMGAVNCTKAVWEAMREQRYGRIVMTSSSSGLWGNFGQSNYAAAKMALVGLMQTLALEGERYNIHVNALAPIATTAMTEALLPADEAQTFAAERVSPAVVFLASDRAPTKAILCAGGGSFERAYVAVTRGAYLGDGPDVAERLADAFASLSDRAGDTVYADGSGQRLHELGAHRAARASGG